MAPEVKRWMEYAENDLAVAKHLFNTFHPKPLEIVCYHCQQAAEKAIKAVYIEREIPGGLPRKHDLSFLLEQMKHHAAVTETLLDHADELNAYGVVVRYPNEIRMDERKATLALGYAQDILAWAKENLNG